MSVKMKKFFLLMCLFGTFSIILLIYMSPSDGIQKIQTRNLSRRNISKSKLSEKVPTKPSFDCDNWIVITTISLPTDDVKYIHDATFDWCTVVVADRKTPVNWNYKKVVFLSVEEQINMAKEFRIIEKIPFNSYLRKMVGYLYAQRHNAKFIYETDDDNSPLDGLLGFKITQFKGLVPNCNNNETFFNPYAYFGQPSVWPRGYPLEKISESTKCSTFELFSSKNVPMIQQGLVNGDPDVDAIYRLTRKNFNANLNIKFDENAPPLVLRPNQYSPFNSQNTWFSYDAFWSLIFPVVFSFRECDIIRSYVTTRLIREIGGRVAFMPPNAVQFRNAHSYHKDYKDEKRIYNDISDLAYSLDEWKCDKREFKKCFLDCIQFLTGLYLLVASD